jgi:hypothetical protein
LDFIKHEASGADAQHIWPQFELSQIFKPQIQSCWIQMNPTNDFGVLWQCCENLSALKAWKECNSVFFHHRLFQSTELNLTGASEWFKTKLWVLVHDQLIDNWHRLE